MHAIDRYINDIEPRIKAIIEYIPKQEEISLQSALASYGWILLDAWVAWRTMRFLLRSTVLDDQNQDKWIQTPSSYTPSQLRSAWVFNESTIDYIQNETGQKYKTLVEGTIQKKRNCSAHFNRHETINGMDANIIKTIFKTLSTVFLAYEIDSFICDAQRILSSKGYQNFSLFMNDTPIDEVKKNLQKYSTSDSIIISCNDNTTNQYEILIHRTKCQARKKLDDHSQWIDVVNDIVTKYSFWTNKGYYQNVGLFCDTIIHCWNQ